MKKWFVIIVIVLVVAGIALVIYLNSSKGKKMLYAKIISAKTGVDYKLYMKQDEGYLKGRANAYQSGAASFTYNGAQYSTETGRKII